MSTRGGATHLELDGVSRCYAATVAGQTIRRHALPATTLGVRRGEWVAVTGSGAAPLTLLRCAAGLVPPDTGRVRWLDHAGREVAPPRVAMIHADRAPYPCWSVRDALWAATSSRVAFGPAGRRVELALRCTGLGAVADRLVAGLSALDRWRVSVAAAVAGGAGWLFLELPPVAAGAGTPADAPDAALAALPRMGRMLATLGVGALVTGAGAPPLAFPFAFHRRVSLSELAPAGEGSADHPGLLARVAESGEGAWERAGTGVASPPWQL